MVIQHNLAAMGSNRFLGINTGKQAKNTEKLSSGYRINRAADDAAGLAISEKMRRQIRGLTRASENAQDGISLVQSAEGALQEVHEMLQRGNELAIQAANGTLSDYDRELIDLEIQQLKGQIDQSAKHTVFNEVRLFPDGEDAPVKSPSRHYEISINLKDGTRTVRHMAGQDPLQPSGRAGSALSTGNALADLIANELVPNAVENIMIKFPALRDMQNNEVVQIGLDIGNIDGKGNVAAFAQASFTGSGRPIEMKIKVDSADYSDSDITGANTDKLQELESTITHELMHSVMQYNLTDGMTGRNGDAYPEWFVEGTAQLAGGGADWNAGLIRIAESLSGSGDSSQDAAIADYLNDYTMDGRPYGHGYLAAAYLGYKASTGSGDFSSDRVTEGMNRIFEQLRTNSFEDAIFATTGLRESDLNDMFRNGNAELVEFVRKLAYATGDGAGSFVANSVSDKDVLPATASRDQAFLVDPDKVAVMSGQMTVMKSLSLQVGADAEQTIEVNLFRMDSKALGIEDASVKTEFAAQAAIGSFKDALAGVSQVRSYYGSVQNRLEHTIKNLDNVVENTTAAESGIRDTDMAKTMVEYSNHQILLQAGQSMLAQANRQSEGILGLLG